MLESKNRYLNAAYFTEVIAGRLNGSAKQAENKPKNGFNNVTYIKKIGGRATVSAPCQKYNIKRFIKEKGFELSKRTKVENRMIISADPSKYIDEDIFGFMRAEKDELNQEEYEKLSKEEQDTFTKSKNKYLRNITKKRKSNFQMSHLTNISNARVDTEWNIASSSLSDNLPYQVEVTSGIFAGISNININGIGKYKISDVESEFRDYSSSEPVMQKDIDISKQQKYKRIEAALRGLQYLNIEGNQNNYLTDTTPKFVILAEYSWGNNVFQGIIKSQGVDIEALKETIEENEEFRLTDIYIGVSRRITNEKYKDLREQLENELEDCDYVHVSTIKKTFDSYLEYLKETIMK